MPKVATGGINSDQRVGPIIRCRNGDVVLMPHWPWRARLSFHHTCRKSEIFVNMRPMILVRKARGIRNFTRRPSKMCGSYPESVILKLSESFCLCGRVTDLAVCDRALFGNIRYDAA